MPSCLSTSLVEAAISLPSMSLTTVWRSRSSSYVSAYLCLGIIHHASIVPWNSPGCGSHHSLYRLVFHKQDLPRKKLPHTLLTTLSSGLALYHHRHVRQPRSSHSAQPRLCISRLRAHDSLLRDHVDLCICVGLLSDKKGVPIPNGRSAFWIRHGCCASFYSWKQQLRETSSSQDSCAPIDGLFLSRSLLLRLPLPSTA